MLTESKLDQRNGENEMLQDSLKQSLMRECLSVCVYVCIGVCMLHVVWVSVRAECCMSLSVYLHVCMSVCCLQPCESSLTALTHRPG